MSRPSAAEAGLENRAAIEALKSVRESSVAPLGLDFRAFRSTGLPKNEFSRTHWSAAPPKSKRARQVFSHLSFVASCGLYARAFFFTSHFVVRASRRWDAVVR